MGNAAKVNEPKPAAPSERCSLCGATEKLSESHIYPDFFIRSLETEVPIGPKGQKHRASIALSTRPEMKGGVRPRGYWEKKLGFKQMLLCQKCEVRLSQYEGAFRKFFYGRTAGRQLQKETKGDLLVRHPEGSQPDGIYEARRVAVNYLQFKLFVLSLLWRAGVAAGQFFRHVDLGPHEERLRKLLVAENPGPDDEYAIVLVDLRHDGSGLENMIEQPGWVRDEYGQRFYKLIVGGFLFMVYVSSREQKPPDFVEGFRLRASGQLVMGVANAERMLRWWAERLHAAGALTRK